MYKSIKFINRKNELAQILQMAQSPQSQLLYMQGDGGIGKTRLLEESPRFLQANHIAAIYPDIIDFDDLMFQFSDNLIHLLLDRIPNITDGDKEPIYKELEALSWMERVGDSRKTQERQERQIIEKLATLVNRISHTKTVIFRFDTAEKMPPNIRESILYLATHLTNAHIVISGRPESNRDRQTPTLWQQISNPIFENRRTRIDLKPFDREASIEYLEEKEDQRNIKLSANDVEALLKLSEGRPIIIDLAVEYFAKSPASKQKGDMGVLRTSPKKFESQIVQFVTSIRGEMERLILVISRVFPLTDIMLAELLHLSESDAQRLFKDAQSEAFIKSIKSPDGTIRITLHDEMRRLILEHVWDEIDPKYYRRRTDSERATALFKSEDEDLHKKISRIQEQKRDLSREYDSVASVDLMLLRRQREVATEKWVEHALYNDFSSGFQEWHSLVEKIRLMGRKYSFVDRLCQLVRPYIEADNSKPIPLGIEPTEWEKFEYQFIAARAKQDLGDYKEAEEIYKTLLAENPEDNARQRQIYNVLGVLKRDQGLLDEAVEYQQKCRELVNDSDYRVIANVENQLGYLHNLLKDADPKNMEKAQEHCEKALSAAYAYHKGVTDSDEKKQVMSLIASIKNNLGYIYGLKREREFEKAELYCKQAIDLWERIGRVREIAWAKTNLGILARDQRQYQHAQQRLYEAIALLSPPDDFRELCRSYLHLGWTQWFMGLINSKKEQRIVLLEEAKKSLELGLKFAQDHDYKQELPDIYHQTASVYWYLGRETNNKELKDKARSYNQKAIEFSKELKNHRYAVDAIVGEMEFDYDSEIDEHIQIHLKQLEPYRKYNFPLYFGRVHRILGDWARRKGDFDETINEYSKAMPLINQHGGHGPYTIEIELENLSKWLESLPLNKAIDYLKILQEKWANRGKSGYVDLLFWIEEQVTQIELFGKGE